MFSFETSVSTALKFSSPSRRWKGNKSPNLNVLLVALRDVVVQGEQEGEGEEEAETLEKKLDNYLLYF